MRKGEVGTGAIVVMVILIILFFLFVFGTISYDVATNTLSFDFARLLTLIGLGG